MYARYASIRDSKGMTDNAVAVATGITQSTIYDWKQRAAKNPRASLSMENAKKIADFLGVSVDDLLKKEE